MDFRKSGDTTTGGSDGCVNFDDPDNKGLVECITASGIQSVYDTYCDEVSLADFIVISGEAATARTASTYNATEPFQNGSLESKFLNRFKAGRTTAESCPENVVGTLPNAENGCDDLKTTFIDHVFAKHRNTRFRWKLTAAISGAHTIGQAKRENSGFDGIWSDPANQDKFNNDYFRSLVLKGWGPKALDATHNQWQRVDSFVATAGERQQMMLSSDICLAYQHNSPHDECVDKNVAAGMSINKANGKCKSFQKKGTFLNANSANCCAWTNSKALFNQRVLQKGAAADYCGAEISQKIDFADGRTQCCKLENATSESTGDCDSAKWPKGPAFGAVVDFAESERTWLKFYTAAWWTATQNGHDDLVRVSMADKK